MASVAKVQASLSILGPSASELNLLHSLSVSSWIGPFTIAIPNGTVLQNIIVMGVQGLSQIHVFAITSDQSISIFYNANTQGLPLTANGFHIFSDTTIIAVQITNVAAGE